MLALKNLKIPHHIMLVGLVLSIVGMLTWTLSQGLYNLRYETTQRTSGAAKLDGYDRSHQSSGRKIMIFQHISPDVRIQKLAQASIQSHRRYANLHGYDYRINLGNYIEQGDAGTGYMNKIYALLSVVLQELEKGPRAVEWIMWTDTDTIVVNPLIALEDLLPPDWVPHPLILANQDGNGFNDGVTLWKVEPRLATFLAAALTLERAMVKAWRDQDGQEKPPSDQRAIALTIMADNEIQDRASPTLYHGCRVSLRNRTDNLPVILVQFYEIPMKWMNAYTLPGESSSEEGAQDRTYTPHLQIHLVADLKYDRAVEPILEYAEAAYRRLEVSGLALELEKTNVREAAREWWKDRRGTIQGMHFSDI